MANKMSGASTYAVAQRTYADLAGVDFCNIPSQVALNRSPDALNIYKNYLSTNGQAIETRPGITNLGATGSTVYGLHILDTKVDSMYKTTVNEYADMLRAEDFSEAQIESYLDEAMKTTGIENQKSAIVKLQGEMGNGNALSDRGDGYAQRMKQSGVENPPSTVAEFEALKYNDPREYKLLNGYLKAVDKGETSPLNGYETYKKTALQTETDLVGLTTSNGIIIEDYVTHFIDRIIGQYKDSSAPLPNMRKGVSIKDVKETLLEPVEISDELVKNNGDVSIIFTGLNCKVTINPKTHKLIQTNPIKRKGK